MTILRPLVACLVFGAIWWGVTAFAGIPGFMLPSPPAVAAALADQRDLLFWNALITFSEILLGLVFGTLAGGLAALAIAFSPRLQRWLMPILVLSQAIPVFTLAPLLVLWFGFGMGSKIIMAVLIIFFPVTANFADGLRRTEPGWLDLAHTMGASRIAILRHIRLPAALPAFASGLRVATAIAPIGAILGEYAGASSGLGYVMINANARMQTDTMFAALFILCAAAIALYLAVDGTLRRLLFWAPGG
ncbi:MAG: ABC transporter permease [Rhodospirillales bacterium 20-64-7]|nr:MAG: ABC transporter permease [Rhodospirillales bacterium 20-64-7]